MTEPKPTRHLLGISGGKDSQACLKLALSEYKNNEILGLFCDTKCFLVKKLASPFCFIRFTHEIVWDVFL